jgi:hypothetical protein
MYTISVEPQPTMKMNIHNQFSDFRLTNGGYFSSGAYWDENPNWRLDAGGMMSIGLRPFLATFEGVLMYQLQRDYAETDDRSDGQLRSTHILLFITWKSEGYRKLRASVNLIGCDRQFYWDLAKLKEYHQTYASQLGIYNDPIEDTWLVGDDTVLMTRLELGFAQKDGMLNITISEGIENEHTRRPIWIDLER